MSINSDIEALEHRLSTDEYIKKEVDKAELTQKARSYMKEMQALRRKAIETYKEQRKIDYECNQHLYLDYEDSAN